MTGRPIIWIFTPTKLTKCWVMPRIYENKDYLGIKVTQMDLDMNFDRIRGKITMLVCDF